MRINNYCNGICIIQENRKIKKPDFWQIKISSYNTKIDEDWTLEMEFQCSSVHLWIKSFQDQRTIAQFLKELVDRVTEKMGATKGPSSVANIIFKF